MEMVIKRKLSMMWLSVSNAIDAVFKLSKNWHLPCALIFLMSTFFCSLATVMTSNNGQFDLDVVNEKYADCSCSSTTSLPMLFTQH